MESVVRLNLNGHAPKKADAAGRKRPPAKQPPRSSRVARRVAVGVGAVGVGVLSLSVYHCTEAICLLTGSHWALAGLLAVGIDAGMVASEAAWLVSHGTLSERTVRPWSQAYIVATVALSMLLNGYAFGLHAAPAMVWAAWLLGGFVPAAVYALGRVTGHLWLGE